MRPKASWVTRPKEIFIFIGITVTKTLVLGLRGNLTANVFGAKHDIDNMEQLSICNYKGSPTRSKPFTNFGPQTLKNRTRVLPILSKYCILLHCQAWAHGNVTEFNKPRQTVGNKSC